MGLWLWLSLLNLTFLLEGKLGILFEKKWFLFIYFGNKKRLERLTSVVFLRMRDYNSTLIVHRLRFHTTLTDELGKQRTNITHC